MDLNRSAPREFDGCDSPGNRASAHGFRRWGPVETVCRCTRGQVLARGDEQNGEACGLGGRVSGLSGGVETPAVQIRPVVFLEVLDSVGRDHEA
jgi:hypothetical protein